MPKYMVLYNSSTSASEVMANTTPEQMKASMGEWIEWRDEASKTIKVDFGMPLQAVSHVTSEGVTDGESQVSGYSIMEGDSKEAVLGVVKSHPQLKQAGASIDVLEMLSMPGLDV